MDWFQNISKVYWDVQICLHLTFSYTYMNTYIYKELNRLWKESQAKIQTKINDCQKEFSPGKSDTQDALPLQVKK